MALLNLFVLLCVALMGPTALYVLFAAWAISWALIGAYSTFRAVSVWVLGFLLGICEALPSVSGPPEAPLAFEDSEQWVMDLLQADPVESYDWMQQEGEAHLSVSGAALAAIRLRPRARWVRVLEAAFGGRHVGSFFRGRWVPDLPSSGRTPLANAMLANLAGGARLLGGGVIAKKIESGPSRVARLTEFRDEVRCLDELKQTLGGHQLVRDRLDEIDEKSGGGSQDVGQVYYILELPEGEQVLVFPDLLARLQAYSVFRQRDTALVQALRARAREWCKLSLPAWVWPLAMPGAVALATRHSSTELACAPLVVDNSTLLFNSA